MRERILIKSDLNKKFHLPDRSNGRYAQYRRAAFHKITRPSSDRLKNSGKLFPLFVLCSYSFEVDKLNFALKEMLFRFSGNL